MWGRTRLPATEADWGSHTFKITKHQHAENAVGDAVNNFFPIAHTCFFQLELPRYTTREAMKVRALGRRCPWGLCFAARAHDVAATLTLLVLLRGMACCAMPGQSRLLYAARNCAGIDADDTMEGRANMGMTVSDSDSD